MYGTVAFQREDRVPLGDGEGGWESQQSTLSDSVRPFKRVCRFLVRLVAHAIVKEGASTVIPPFFANDALIVKECKYNEVN